MSILFKFIFNSEYLLWMKISYEEINEHNMSGDIKYLFLDGSKKNWSTGNSSIKLLGVVLIIYCNKIHSQVSFECSFEVFLGIFRFSRHFL